MILPTTRNSINSITHVFTTEQRRTKLGRIIADFLGTKKYNNDNGNTSSNSNNNGNNDINNNDKNYKYNNNTNNDNNTKNLGNVIRERKKRMKCIT